MKSYLTAAELDALIADATANAHGHDEQFSGFLRIIQNSIEVPVKALLAGHRVTVLSFGSEGTQWRRITAKVRSSPIKPTYDVSEIDLEIDGAHTIAAHRKWLGLSPYLGTVTTPNLFQYAVVSTNPVLAFCRSLPSGKMATVILAKAKDAVPGEILTTNANGNILSRRIDAQSLGLKPLALKKLSPWDPKDGKTRPKPAYEMEQIIPGEDPDDHHSDPIIEAADLAASGDKGSARTVLNNLCAQDLRCLDAHAHLGIIAFAGKTKAAAELSLRHYEVGVRIGELSLGDNFDGFLLWGTIDNRPFHRCLVGYGLSLWRLKRFDEAAQVFERMLNLNPPDNLGAREMLDDARARQPWRDR